MQRKSAALLLLGSCALAGFGAWVYLEQSGGTQFRTAAVEHGDINVAISATGSPNAVVTVQIGSQVSGTIQSLYADFNTKVTKDQLIARIDPAALQARVDQGQASLDSAREGVANAEHRRAPLRIDRAARG
ncbi:biotin/lipoyl-binding protein [Paludibaculum fermentans]|uniref:biotin/lipoyl-binding protein n=1 Tax=Paludibaculum fermentans TaxID=1473598 RepID=UPI003EBA9959